MKQVVHKYFIYHESGFADIWLGDFVCHPDQVCGCMANSIQIDRHTSQSGMRYTVIFKELF